MTNGPSTHLSWAELACKDGTPYPREWRSTRVIPVAIEFEFLRAVCGGKPIRVLSAYRTPEHNRRVGGAPNSEHVQGRALDLAPPAGMHLLAFAEVINTRAEARDSYIGGIGVYRSFVHIDTRRTDSVVRWIGSRQIAEGPLKGEENG